MPKNTKKTRTKTKKKLGKNVNLTTDSLIQKYETISKQFEIRISPVIAKIEFKPESLNQIRHCFTGHIQI